MQAPVSGSLVKALVAAAKTRRSFKPLTSGAAKSDALWLLELAVVDSFRPAVVHAFEWIA